MKNIVITGGNRGIGLALTKKFKNEGHNLTVLCRQSSKELDDLGVEVMTGVDVTNLEVLEKTAAHLSDIDLLINNAGVLYQDSLDNLNFDHLETQLQVNTVAPLKVAATIGKKVKKGGVIGILTSRMGSISDNGSGGYYGYRASKAAANAVGKSLALDLKDKEVTVLLLHPGYVKTEMTGNQGLIDTTESAEGLYKVITEHSRLSDTGTFWHSNGEEIPW